MCVCVGVCVRVCVCCVYSVSSIPIYVCVSIYNGQIRSNLSPSLPKKSTFCSTSFALSAACMQGRNIQQTWHMTQWPNLVGLTSV